MYIGLDQSTTATGIALYYPEKQIVEYGIIRPGVDIYLDWFKRIDYMVETAFKYIEQCWPDRVFIEQPRYSAGSNASITNLIGLDILIKYKLFKLDIPFTTLNTNGKKEGKEGWPFLTGAEGTKEHFAKLIQPYCSTQFVKATHHVKDGLPHPVKKYIDQDVMTYDASDAIGILLGGLRIKEFEGLTFTPFNPNA